MILLPARDRHLVECIPEWSHVAALDYGSPVASVSCDLLESGMKAGVLVSPSFWHPLSLNVVICQFRQSLLW
jgi:hypothetical protein